MKNDLQFALLDITSEALDELGFADIAQRIEDSRIRRTYRKLAITLLEANILEHQASRPSAVALIDAGKLLELQDWQEVTFTWERAIWALASQGDT
jgi:hypothetical protein